MDYVRDEWEPDAERMKETGSLAWCGYLYYDHFSKGEQNKFDIV